MSILTQQLGMLKSGERSLEPQLVAGSLSLLVAIVHADVEQVHCLWMYLS